MDQLLIVVTALVGLFVALDVTALRYGVDSREPIGDDHVR